MKLIKLTSRPYFSGFLTALLAGVIFTFILADYVLQLNNEISFQVYKIVALTLFVISFVYFLIIFFQSKSISKKLETIFNEAIFELDSYDVKNNKQLKTSPTNITEFQKLNNSIEEMTGKIEKDYRLLKEYTENVSHEIQTPLAIIKNKIELLLQDQTLNKEHLLTLAKLHQSTGRLSKLSKNLAVLTKIENNQFVKDSEIYLADFITERLEDFEELIELKNIKLDTNFEDNPKLSINSTLAYLLFNNLISNAVRHNISKGKISISITKNKFIITNTGNPLKTSKMDLFNRFTKSTDNVESTGLGLAMVKKIVSFYGFFIAYKNENDLHQISVIFIDKVKQKSNI